MDQGILEHLGEKTLIVFDLDGTLTESKAPITANMAEMLEKLLRKKKVAIIGGGRYEQFRDQLVARLSMPVELFENLYLFPTSSTAFYRYEDGWKRIYSEDFSPEEKQIVMEAFFRVFQEFQYTPPEHVYGEVIEDRGTQITFSAVGQQAPVQEKEKWNAKNDALRGKMASALSVVLLEFEVRSGGLTSIDITRKGIDKAYGIKKIEEYLGVSQSEMLFIGDRIFPGGNDYAVTKTNVAYIQVSGPDETKKMIEEILNK